jgi:hypothetical protein
VRAQIDPMHLPLFLDIEGMGNPNRPDTDRPPIWQQGMSQIDARLRADRGSPERC